MPIIVQLLPHERSLRSRTKPKVVIDPCRRLLRTADLADRFAQRVVESAGVLDLAKFAVLDVLEGLREADIRAALHTDLHDALVFARRIHHLAAFPHGMGTRLLY